MQFLSVSFIILWTLAFALYYLIPSKLQWYVLLIAGLLFYIAGSKGIPAALLMTALTTYGCGLYLQKNLARQKEALETCDGKEQKKRMKEAFAKKRKGMQILYFIVNLGLLVFYKYTVFALPVLQKTPGFSAGLVEKLIMPLGISFYTLTAMGASGPGPRR